MFSMNALRTASGIAVPAAVWCASLAQAEVSTTTLESFGSRRDSEQMKPYSFGSSFRVSSARVSVSSLSDELLPIAEIVLELQEPPHE